MWQCKICETMNDDQSIRCVVCGRDKLYAPEIKKEKEKDDSRGNNLPGTTPINPPVTPGGGSDHIPIHKKTSPFVIGLCVLLVIAACIGVGYMSYNATRRYDNKQKEEQYEYYTNMVLSDPTYKSTQITTRKPTTRPTATSKPTYTPRPTATATPRPTNTPKPTYTPRPTPTVAPITSYVRLEAWANSWARDNVPSVDASRLIDGNHNLSWDSDGYDRYNPPMFSLETTNGKSYLISGFRIKNGKNKAEDPAYYSYNARIKKVEITYVAHTSWGYDQEKTAGTYTLNGSVSYRGEWQYFYFTEPVVTDQLYFKITEIYPGDRWNDVCVAEIELF